MPPCIRIRVPLLLTLCALSAAPASAAPSFPSWMSNGLYRTITGKERTYFGKPLADVVLAMDKAAQDHHHGHCTAELSSGDPADMSRPQDWLRDQGKLTPAGLAPSSWEVPVSCPGLHAVISLSPETLLVVPEAGDKPVGAGADVFASSGHVVIGDFVVLTTKRQKLDTTKGTSAADWADMPSLAKPVAIQVRSDQFTGDLLDFIDVDAARAALTAANPPARSAPAVESDEQQGDPGTIKRTEASVLAYLASRSPKKTIVVADKTWRGGLPTEAEAILPGLAPELLPSAVADYREKNKESQPLPTSLHVAGASVVLVSEDALRGLFEKVTPAQGWAKFNQTYGDTQLLTFSRVGLSRDLSQAVVFQGYQGPRVATGSLLFLRREADTWRVMYTLRLWVE